MALEITGNIELNSGVVLNSVYARVNPTLSTSGDEIRTSVSYWLDENTYNNGSYPLNFSVPLSFRYEYNRGLDGTDLLLVSNQKIKYELEMKGFSVVITNI
jgi:hypothetical protein